MSNSTPGICVFSEKENVTLELLSKGRELANATGTLLSSIYLGASSPDPKPFGEHGADVVLVGKNLQLNQFNPDTAVQALFQILSTQPPILFMIGATKEGREIGARLAQRLNVGYSSECLDVRIDNGTVFADRATLAGTYLSQQRIFGKPAIVSIPPRRFQASNQSSRTAEIKETPVEISPSRCTILEVRSRGAGGDVELEKAETIIAVGRGLRRKEDLTMIEGLAKAVGGEVGSSRPLSEDLKWLPENRQVGLSGHKVQPKLYIACGISGQMQHIAGMLNSKIVVAINTDAKAPIFEQSDYGVVADIYMFIPALTAAILRLKQKSA